ncbi:PREDICTED: major facilitator superfamily domain-containing protein 12-like isoform X2 [Camelina sativa]|uniref:Major facilitator superfamily domain-containing protein 12-like isoform X2 n=1 Tax=Camelina sativa TaxID=90675 RepID=A0ABM1RQ97_CAMSA|nr:PREDICTED: major facilitator superfamily domain-containing protein 12-like isoform X2 [Camelina sativa]
MTSPVIVGRNDEEEEDPSTKPLGRLSVFYYGVGHMLNDITASCWFTYLLLFLTQIGLSPRDAAIVMLSGQVADGFATVFVGELIDRFGHFKIWHAAGSLLVAVSFSSVFGGCLPCTLLNSNSLTVETLSYSMFAAIFNIGWAATQVSHMAMVNCITLNSTSRVALTSSRNAFSMVANLGLYAIALVVFGVSEAGTKENTETQEPRLRIDLRETSRARIPWSYWFRKILYYQVAMVYLLTRLVLNVSQAYLAFFVIDDLQMAQSAKALIPAIIYICSFVVSVMLQEIPWNGKRLKAYYCAGGIIWIFCGVAILLLSRSINIYMYAISIFIGIANALMLVTAISMQSVLIGSELGGCAFVCGSLSFLDKMSCGLALYVLQSHQSTSPKVDVNINQHFYFSVTRYGLGLVPAVCSLIGVVVTYFMELDSTILKPLRQPLLLE